MHFGSPNSAGCTRALLVGCVVIVPPTLLESMHAMIDGTRVFSSRSKFSVSMLISEFDILHPGLGKVESEAQQGPKAAQ